MPEQSATILCIFWKYQTESNNITVLKQFFNFFKKKFKTPWLPKVNEIELLIYSTTILYKLVTKASHQW